MCTLLAKGSVSLYQMSHTKAGTRVANPLRAHDWQKTARFDLPVDNWCYFVGR